MGKIVTTFLLFAALLMVGCTQLIDPPKNLLPKQKMSELIAQFAINDQLNNYFPNTNMENATRTVLRENNSKGTDFAESFKYYTASGEIDEILNNAQKIILERDPKAKNYINQKITEKPDAQTFEQ